MPKVIHIATIADEKYKTYMAAMISSAMKSAGDKFTLVFHIVKDGLTDETIRIFEDFIVSRGHKIKWLKDISSNVDIPLTMYFTRAASLRLFLADMIDESVDTVIYIDSDTILCENGIEQLANVDVGHYALGAVGDANVDFKYMNYRIGITDRKYMYFNSGVMVINLKKWREENATQKHLQILKDKYERLVFVDQDILNLAWKEDLLRLPLNFNVTSANYALAPKFLAKGNGGPYYTTDEIKNALENPYVLHFYGFLYNRPWKDYCFHPKKQAYIDAANDSPYPFELERSTHKEKIESLKVYYLGHRLLLFRRYFAMGKNAWRKLLRMLNISIANIKI